MAAVQEDLDVVKQFLAENNRAVLMTHRRDGGIQSSPMSVVADDAGNVLITTRATAAKVKNLKRDPRATVCLMTERFLGAWMQVEGTAEIAYLPDAYPALQDFFRRRGADDSSSDAFRARMESEQRVLITVRTEKVVKSPVRPAAATTPR